MFLHQGTQVLNNSIDVVTYEPHLQPISNKEVPSYFVATIPTRNLVYVSQTHHVYVRTI